MRWLVSYIVGTFVTAGLFMLFIGYGIGGCDCGIQERGFFCWLCDHQWVYAAFATSPLWIIAALQLRSNWLQHRRDLERLSRPPADQPCAGRPRNAP